jgi:hypothetical protein
MSTLQRSTPATALGTEKWAKLRQQYGAASVLASSEARHFMCAKWSGAVSSKVETSAC